MNVKELIEELRKHPLDATVYISDIEGLCSFLLHIEEFQFKVVFSDSKIENKEPYTSKEVIDYLESFDGNLSVFIKHLDYPSNLLTEVDYAYWNNSIILITL